MLFSIAVASCGGGGGSNGGNTSGTAAPSYVVQGGLVWMPETFQDNWINANSYCANTTINGQTGWRMPTQPELSALYASGLMKGHGWALSYDWSSTSNGAGNHYTVGLYDGSIHTTSDTSTFYVSCVRSYINGNGGGTGTGVTFSRFIGFNTLQNTHINSVGVYDAGAYTVRAGAEYSWSNPLESGGTILPGATLYYTPAYTSTNPNIPSMGDKIQLLFNSGNQAICFVNLPVPANNYPICSSVGINFDRVAGMITLASTPLLALFTPTNITATGSLTFAPF